VCEEQNAMTAEVRCWLIDGSVGERQYMGL